LVCFAGLTGVTGRSGVQVAQFGQIRSMITIGLLVVLAASIPLGLGD
jgi:hypothetical protein